MPTFLMCFERQVVASKQRFQSDASFDTPSRLLRRGDIVGRSSRSTIKLFIIIMLLSSEVGGFIGKTKHGELSLFANTVC